MHQRRIPEWLRHAPTPSVRGFATLAGTEAMARGILISVMPLEMYRALRDAALVSEIYFMVGLLSLATGLMVPFVSRFMPRRWIYVTGCAMFAGGAAMGAQGGALGMIAALAMITAATVTVFVCFNAYVLDFIAKSDLGRCETSRMFYSALGWTVGPFLGVTLLGIWRPLPFMIAALAALSMMALFLYLRLGNGKLITRARRPAPNPLAWMPRFFAQPRLVAGWIFAVIDLCRSAGLGRGSGRHVAVSLEWHAVSHALHVALDAAAVYPPCRAGGLSCVWAAVRLCGDPEWSTMGYSGKPCRGLSLSGVA